MNLPNTISFVRFAAVPVTVWLILNDGHAAAFWLFLAAGLSDAVDGYLAKRFDAVTALGGYLDPVADKALLVGVYVALGMEGVLPSWLVMLVVVRDLSIVGGWLLLIGVTGARRVRPLWVSKINTVLQIVLAGLVLAGHALPGAPIALVPPLVYAVAATTVLSGLAYALRVVRATTQVEPLP